jgi:hypothetical protein
MSDQVNPLLGPGIPVALLHALSPRAEFVKPPVPRSEEARRSQEAPAAVFTPGGDAGPDEQLRSDLRRLAALQKHLP